jgi:hypothetical protein
LHGDQRVFIAAVNNVCPPTIMRDHPVAVFRDVGGVDAEKIVILGRAVADDVVHDATLGVTQDRVLCLPEPRQRGISDHQFLTHLQGPRTSDLNLPHMAEVEQSRPGAHGLVFGQDAGVLYGHLPTAELGHARTQDAVSVIERSAFGHTRSFQQSAISFQPKQ